WTQRLLARAQRARSASRADRVAQAEQTVTDQPNDLEAWMKLADELIGVGQRQAAVQRLLQVQERFADVGAYHRCLADALLMSSRRQEGITRYRQAVRLEPDNAAWSAELAAVLLDRRADGDLAEARVLIDRAYALAPRSIAVRLCRAELLTLDNRPTEAAALYRAVAADLPPDSDLRRTCEMRARSLTP
ncbi:MAG: tetratricopeptide repeat protein, partial [Planctomycetes bacterium]|nr:tetratricopeptide repeat protein [Planctomycetota bacterium]